MDVVDEARRSVTEKVCGRPARLCGDSKAGEGLRVASLDQIRPIKSARLVFEAVVAGFFFFFLRCKGGQRSSAGSWFVSAGWPLDVVPECLLLCRNPPSNSVSRR